MKPNVLYNVKGKVLLSFSFLSLSALLVLSSCKKETPDPAPQPDPSYHLNVSTLAIQSPAAAGNSTAVHIEANAPWTVTVPANINWVEVSKSSGNSDDEIHVKIIKENTTGTVRTAAISVALVNGKAPAKTITVAQDFSVSTPVNIAWKKVLGGNGNDYGYSIIKTPDGGYLLSGRTSSNNSGDVPATHGGIDMWVVKLDAAGSITWQKTFGGNGDEYSVAAANTPDAGYVLTGFTTSNNNGDVGANHGYTDFWVVKINANGTLQWQKTLGGTSDDRPNAITVTTEGRIAVAGFTTSNNGDVSGNHGNEDMWVMLLDNGNGNFLWKKTFGGNGSETAKALAPAPNGGVYVGGNTSSINNGDVGAGKGSSDFWLLSLDRNLSIQWKNSLGGTNIEDLNALATGPNNTLVAAGTTKSNNSGDVGASKGGEDLWIVQLNATTGVLAWQKVLGGSVIDVAKGLVVKADGSMVVAAYSYSDNSGDVGISHGAGDFWVVQLNSTGGIGWKKLLGGDSEDQAFSIAEANDGGLTIAGATMSNNSGDVGAGYGNSDAWLVKLKEE
jgi:hypothetical protein